MAMDISSHLAAQAMKHLEGLTLAICMQALEQATFALPKDLRTALVQCSVPLPTPLAYLAIEFDDYGYWLVTKFLSRTPYITHIAHPGGHQALLEGACSGLTLQEALPHFASIIERCASACMLIAGVLINLICLISHAHCKQML